MESTKVFLAPTSEENLNDNNDTKHLSQSSAADTQQTRSGNSSNQLNSENTLPVSRCTWRILLIISVFMYSSYTLFVHLSETNGRLPFRPSALVLLIEVTKFLLSLVMFAAQMEVFRLPGVDGMAGSAYCSVIHRVRNSCRCFGVAVVHQLRSAVPRNHGSASGLVETQLTWKAIFFIVLPFTVPAVLYAINNNLGLFIQLQMDPATYQVFGNFKILSTALLFRLIIKRPISHIQWFALLLLLIAGVTNSFGSLFKQSDVISNSSVLHITPVGLLMVSVYCTISGLSGVYTEFVMKKQAQMSIHLQNSLLYIFGILINGVMFLLEASQSSEPDAFNVFRGFNKWVWLLLITQSIIGIFMGFVMKFADNIVRLFIISSAMLVTTVLSVLIFGLTLNIYFGITLVLVLTALYLYHR